MEIHVQWLVQDVFKSPNRQLARSYYRPFYGFSQLLKWTIYGKSVDTTERISSFLDLLLQPIAQKKGYYTLYKLHWKRRIPRGSYFSYTGRVFILH